MRLASLLTTLCLSLHVAAAAAEEPRGARQLYDGGIEHYKMGEFEAAIVDFKAAYALEPSAILLFNLAQAHRQLGDGKRALFFYRAFVREAPPSEARADAERMVAVLEGQDPPAVPPTAASGGMRASAPGARGALTRRDTIAIVASTAAFGTTLVLTGVGLSVRASQASDALQALPVGTPWDDASRSRYDDGQASSQAAIGLYVVGGAAIAASVITAIVYRDRLTHAEPRPTAGQKGLSWAF